MVSMSRNRTASISLGPRRPGVRRRLGRGATAGALLALGLPAAANAARTHVATSSAPRPAVAYTRINPIGRTNSGTGTSAAPPINAEVATVDTGNSIDTTGVGTGFQKQGLYVSVLYENGSNVTGPKACLPAGKVNFGDRVIGAWVPDGATTRVLAPVTEVGQAYAGSNGPGTGGQLVGNWDRGTISVRMVNLIKPPTLYANLQSCGRVQTASTPSAAVSALWSNALSDSDQLPSTAPPDIGTLKQMLRMPTNPIAPWLTPGRLPTTVSPVTPPTTVRTITVPSPGRTVTQTQTQTLTQTRTVTTPATTVTVAKVVTVTAPAVTVTVPGLSRRP